MSEIDDLDIYNDLDEFQEQQEKKGKELQAVEDKYQEALRTIEQLKLENKQLSKKIKIMETNFQSLLDTAKAEIRRKDQSIAHLRREKDDICFRRSKPYVNPFTASNVQQVAETIDSSYNININKPIDKKRTIIEEVDSIQLDKNNVDKKNARHDRSRSPKRKREEDRSSRDRNRSRNRKYSRGRSQPRSRVRNREGKQLKTTRDEQSKKDGERLKRHDEVRKNNDHKDKGHKHAEEKDCRVTKRVRSKDRNHSDSRSSRDSKRLKKEDKTTEKNPKKKENDASRTSKEIRKDYSKKLEDDEKERVKEKKIEVDKTNLLAENFAEKQVDVLKYNKITTVLEKRNNIDESVQKPLENINTPNTDKLVVHEDGKIHDEYTEASESKRVQVDDYLFVFTDTDISDEATPENSPMKDSCIIKQLYDDFIDFDDSSEDSLTSKLENLQPVQKATAKINSNEIERCHESKKNPSLLKLKNNSVKITQSISLNEQNKLCEQIINTNDPIPSEKDTIDSDVLNIHSKSPDIFDGNVLEEQTEKVLFTETYLNGNKHDMKKYKESVAPESLITKSFDNFNDSPESNRIEAAEILSKYSTEIDQNESNYTANASNILETTMVTEKIPEPNIEKNKYTEQIVHSKSTEIKEKKRDSHISEMNIEIEDLLDIEDTCQKIEDIKNSEKIEAEEIVQTKSTEIEEKKRDSNISEMNIEIEDLLDIEDTCQNIEEIKNSEKNNSAKNRQTSPIDVQQNERNSNTSEVIMEIEKIYKPYIEEIKISEKIEAEEIVHSKSTEIEEKKGDSNIVEINMEIEDLLDIEDTCQNIEEIKNSEKNNSAKNRQTSPIDVQQNEKDSNTSEMIMEIEKISKPHIEKIKNSEKIETEKFVQTEIEQKKRDSNISEIIMEIENISQHDIAAVCQKVEESGNSEKIEAEQILQTNSIEQINEKKDNSSNDIKNNMKWGTFKIPKKTTPPKLQWGSFKIPKKGTSADNMSNVKEKTELLPNVKTNSNRVNKSEPVKKKGEKVVEQNTTKTSSSAVVVESLPESYKSTDISPILRIEYATTTTAISDNVPDHETSSHNSTMAALVEEIFDKSAEQCIILPSQPTSLSKHNCNESDGKIEFDMQNIFQSPRNEIATAEEADVSLLNLNSSIPPEPTESVFCSTLNLPDINMKDLNISGDLNNTGISVESTVTQDTSFLNSSSEIKQLSMGSSSYVFEKVSENVINLHITRQRHKKRKKKVVSSTASLVS